MVAERAATPFDHWRTASSDDARRAPFDLILTIAGTRYRLRGCEREIAIFARRREIEVVLPTVGPPDRYTGAVVFLRGVEQRMRRHPSLAALADAAGTQFIDDEVAEFVFVSLIPEIDRQAMAAKRDGSASLTPRVHGKPQVLAHAAGLMERWSEWLRLGDKGWGRPSSRPWDFPPPRSRWYGS